MTAPPPPPTTPHPPPPTNARAKLLIIVGATAVALSLLAAVVVSSQRERRARLAIRKQTTAIMLDLTRAMDRAAVAMIAFNSDGGLDLTGLEDRAALERRIGLATAAQTAADSLLAQGDAAPGQLEHALRGRPAELIGEAKQQLPAKLNWPQGRQIFQTHSRAYAAARTHLQFLQRHHGHWRVDPVGLRVNWDSKQLQAEAERLQADVTAAAAAQGKLWSASQPAPATTPTSPSASAPSRD